MGHFCPFELFTEYMKLRGGFHTDSEQFFIFREKIPVTPTHIRTVLKRCIKDVGINERFYDCHSLRVGRTCDLVRLGFTIDEVKRLGRWKSNAVFQYIKS